ncbi:hypothetical protein FRB95_013798 [Tulasnella sp. JGI-2019a]|nr:hypothetical protein FRB95_013798 [Tulasnella sp. JGI-2019a]
MVHAARLEYTREAVSTVMGAFAEVHDTDGDVSHGIRVISEVWKKEHILNLYPEIDGSLLPASVSHILTRALQTTSGNILEATHEVLATLGSAAWSEIDDHNIASPLLLPPQLARAVHDSLIGSQDSPTPATESHIWRWLVASVRSDTTLATAFSGASVSGGFVSALQKWTAATTHKQTRRNVAYCFLKRWHATGLDVVFLDVDQAPTMSDAAMKALAEYVNTSLQYESQSRISCEMFGLVATFVREAFRLRPEAALLCRLDDTCEGLIQRTKDWEESVKTTSRRDTRREEAQLEILRSEWARTRRAYLGRTAPQLRDWSTQTLRVGGSMEG